MPRKRKPPKERLLFENLTAAQETTVEDSGSDVPQDILNVPEYVAEGTKYVDSSTQTEVSFVDISTEHVELSETLREALAEKDLK